MQKTFLLGLGAQKAGTTWLYRYLRAHPECAMGDIKELAVFTGYFDPANAVKRQLKKAGRLQEALQKMKWRNAHDKQNEVADQTLLGLIDNFAADYDLKYYLSYFERLLDAAPEARLVGDITPSYSTLQQDQLAAIKTLLEGAGYRVKVLFLMRDPVERCYSALRMGARRAKQEKNGKPVSAHEAFALNAVSDWCQVRTRYQDIVPRIEAVFAPEDRVIDFYETFLTEDRIRAFCDFLGISHVEANLEKRINTSPREAEPDPGEWATVRRAYEDTYAYCAGKYGADHVAGIWPNLRLET